MAAIGLSPLITCLLNTSDWGLMSAFMERQHKETNSFHLSIGEVTITLDDVASFLHFPITGTFHSFKPFHVDNDVFLLVEFLEVSTEEARVETV